MSNRTGLAILAALATLLASCAAAGGGPTATEPALAQAEEATPEPDALVPRTAPPAPDCVSGWVTPPRSDPLVLEALGIVRRHMAVKGELSLQDLRYFEGPEAPPSDKGYILTIRRWYVKGHLKKDPSLRGRWLVESREFGSGVAAVAPYDTTGFASPDWRGFQWSSALQPKAYEGLPGEWQGAAYDFVNGGAGLDFPGLPGEVRGCLTGT